MQQSAKLAALCVTMDVWLLEARVSFHEKRTRRHTNVSDRMSGILRSVSSTRSSCTAPTREKSLLMEKIRAKSLYIDEELITSYTVAETGQKALSIS